MVDFPVPAWPITTSSPLPDPRSLRTPSACSPSRWPCAGQDLVDRSPAHLSGGAPDPTDGRVHDPALDPEHLDGGVAPVPDRGGPTLPAPARDIGLSVVVAADHPQHVVTSQELSGEPCHLGEALASKARATAARASRWVKVEANSVRGATRADVGSERS